MQIRCSLLPPHIDTRAWQLQAHGMAAQVEFMLEVGQRCKFKDYSPAVFRQMRHMFGVDDEAYLNSVGQREGLSEISTVDTGSKSGQRFLITHDGRYFMKTTTASEARFFMKVATPGHRRGAPYPSLFPLPRTPPSLPPPALLLLPLPPRTPPSPSPPALLPLPPPPHSSLYPYPLLCLLLAAWRLAPLLVCMIC